MTQIVILSTQRSGSTMVCDDIAGTEVMGRPSEYLLGAKKKANDTPSLELRLFIESALKKGETLNGVRAIKVMSDQITSIGKAIRRADISKFDDVRNSFVDFFEQAHFLRVYREDKVAQAVSRVMAIDSRISHVADSIVGMESMIGLRTLAEFRDESLYNYDQKKIRNNLEKIYREEVFLDNLIEDYNLNVFYIRYEDVIDDRTYIYNIAKMIGSPQGIVLGPRRLKKGAGSISASWIERFKNETQ